MANSDLRLRDQAHAAAARLQQEFVGVFAVETIEALYLDSVERLSARAATTAFVPLLAERFTRERLRAAAKVESVGVTATPTVLFLCVHNAGRSQMAAGWLRRLAGDQVVALSGGSTPAHQVNPAAIAAMAQVGIDIAAEYPKPWTDETFGAADVVVTMGCGDACPFVPGKRYLDWELDDPAGLSAEQIRPIRDQIEARVRQLLDDLAITPLG